MGSRSSLRASCSGRIALSATALCATACGIDEPLREPDDGPPPGSWTAFGGDPAHSRHNAAEQQLSRGSVASLALKWSVEAPGVTSTPAVWSDVVYWADWIGTVYATRLSDGGEVWKSTFDRGFTSSPFVTGNRVFVGDRHNTVRALDRRTGEQVWEHAIESSAYAQLWSSPTVAGELLVIGLGGRGTQQAAVALPDADLALFRGAVVALDAATGEQRWRFEVTRGPDGTEYAPGVSIWSTATIDEAAKLVFIGTGNHYFAPAGPYSDALLALDYETGLVVWSRQFTASDSYRAGAPEGGPDFDVGAAPNLFLAGTREVVGVGHKGGAYHALDRRTGEPVWDATLTPGSRLGGIMAPAAVAEGVVYVCSNAGLTTHVVALDTHEGRELWRKEVATMTFGAPAVAGSVLFVGPTGGMAHGLDTAGGAELWQMPLALGRGGGFSISGGTLLTGVGYHFFNDGADPVPGALLAFALSEN